MTRHLRAVLAGAAALLLSSSAAFAKPPHNDDQVTAVRLPLVKCWYDGKVAYYIQTDASDAGVAAQQGVNYVPRLVDAIPDAVDDIYTVTNFAQGNIIPSAPIPAGPGNTDPNYTPLWQVSTVTWAQGTRPRVLRSEAEVLQAAARKEVTLVKTTIVVNCPVIFTPRGGLLPTARLLDDGE